MVDLETLFATNEKRALRTIYLRFIAYWYCQESARALIQQQFSILVHYREKLRIQVHIGPEALFWS